MNNTYPFLSLIIPCFNEANRFHFLETEILNFKTIWPNKFELIIVNDGSKDDTLVKAIAFQKRIQETDYPIQVLNLEKNKGKGFALKTGIAKASGEWFLTLDADMSTKPEELISWLNNLGTFQNNTLYIGSRVHKASNIKAKFNRRFLGGIFNRIMAFFTDLEMEDTQCGFKLYEKNAAKKLFSELETAGWSHDIEILLKAKLSGFKIESMPVKWIHRDGSSINVLKDGIKMILETAAISRKLKKKSNE